MVALSPQQPKYSRQLISKHGLGFAMLHDPGNGTASALGLVWTMPDDMRKVYLDFSIDVPRFNGDESWQLPMPGRYVVDREGIIRAAEVHPDYTTRPEPEEILEALKAIS